VAVVAAAAEARRPPLALPVPALRVELLRVAVVAVAVAAPVHLPLAAGSPNNIGNVVKIGTGQGAPSLFF
jgi:hypothetical protein